MSEDAKTNENLEEKDDENLKSSDTELGGGEKVEEVKIGDGESVVTNENDDDKPWKDRYMEVLQTFWPLGWVAFGGPQAHVAILRVHLVCAS
jgi:hypothetical protein